MADLIIKIGANSREFQTQMDIASSLTEDFKNQTESVAKAATLAWAGISAAVGFSIKQFADAQKIATQTNTILKATGGVAGVTADQIDSLSKALSDVTQFSDEAVREGENIFLTFTKIGEETFPRATEAALDLAVRLGTDAAGAAQILGKALESPTEGLTQLRRSGILFTEDQKRQIKQFEATNNVAAAQKVILDQVNSSIGGLAKESAKGVSGSFLQLKNIFEDIAENIGALFAPAAQTALDKLKALAVVVRDNEQAIKAMGITLAAALVGSGVIAALASIGGIMALWPQIMVAASAAIGLISAPILAIAGAAAGITALVVAFKKLVEVDASRKSGRSEGLVDSKRIDDEKFTQDRITDENKKAQQTRARIEAQERERKRQAEVQSLNDSLLAFQGYSEEYINLLKQYRDNEMALAEETDAQKREIREALREELGTELLEKYETDMLAEEEFQENMAAIQDRYQMQMVDKRSQLYKDLQEESKKNYLSEEKMRTNFLKQELAEEQRHKQQKYNDQVKYGQMYAELNAFMHSAEYQGTAQAFGELEKLTRSKNETLRTIGKAAATANIIMSTAQSAMLIYQGFATIPIIGQALGIAGAAAAIAFGAEQLSTVAGLADGGIVTGGVPGLDSVPAMLMPGELVVPTRNFDEVVSSVADSRSGDMPAGTGGGNSNVVVQIEFNGDASQILTARQIEDRSLGLSRETA